MLFGVLFMVVMVVECCRIACDVRALLLGTNLGEYYHGQC